MFFLLKFAIYFAISFAILCIPLANDTRIFDALYTWTTPYAKEAATKTKQKIATTSKYSKMLFSNSSPTNKDSVSFKKSALQKNDALEINNSSDDGLDLDEQNQNYTEEEKEQILKALKN